MTLPRIVGVPALNMEMPHHPLRSRDIAGNRVVDDLGGRRAEDKNSAPAIATAATGPLVVRDRVPLHDWRAEVNTDAQAVATDISK